MSTFNDRLPSYGPSLVHEIVRGGRRLLFTPYGSAKSAIALAAALEHSATLSRPPVVVIVCKKRNIGTWTDQIAMRFSDVDVYDGSRGLAALMERTRRNWRSDRPTALLVGYPQLQQVATFRPLVESIVALKPTALIADECTTLKNPSARTTQHAWRLSDYCPPDTLRLGLSGNPHPEALTELWSQFQFAYGGSNPLGATLYRFLNDWFVKAGYVYVLRLEREEQFFTLIRKFVVEFTPQQRDEWQRMIGANEPVRIVELYEESAEQRRLLSDMYDAWILPNGQPDLADPVSFDSDIAYATTLTEKARQISSGFYYYNDANGLRQTHYLNTNPKLQLLGELLRERLLDDLRRKIVVWQLYEAERVPMLSSLETVVGSVGARVVCGPDRYALEAFRDDPTVRVIVMPSATTQGFNELVVADTAYYYSSPWSGELREQATARLYRLGQRSKNLFEIDLCSPRSIDRELVAALHSKTLTPQEMARIVVRHAPPPPITRQ